MLIAYLRAALGCFFVVVAINARAQTTVTFSPASPSPSDTVVATVVDNWTGVCPIEVSNGIAATAPPFAIRVGVAVLDPPLPGNCVLTHSFALGMLPAGNYTVEYSVFGGSSSNIFRLTSTALVVGAGLTPNAIPTNSPLGLLLLIVLLIGVAGLAGRRVLSSNGRMSIILLVGAIATMGSNPHAYAVESKPDPLSRVPFQALIVLFDQGNPELQADRVFESVRNKSGLASDLLGPAVSVEPLLIKGESESDRILARESPDSPEILLRKYVIARYASESITAEVVSRLKSDKRVVWVEKNIELHPSSVINDPFALPDPPRPTEGRWQWGLESLNVPLAWDLIRGRSYVGALDTGVSFLQDDLKIFDPSAGMQGNVRRHLSREVTNLVPVQFDPNIDDAGGTYSLHGTHVSGIMVARVNNSVGVAGVCRECSFSMFRSSSLDGFSLMRGLEAAMDSGVQVVNMSLGADSPQDTYCALDAGTSAYCAMVKTLRGHGVVAVAASGNNNLEVMTPARIGVLGSTAVQYPASDFPYVIAVAGVNISGNVWENDPRAAGFGSSGGPEVEVAAPAQNVLSTHRIGTTYNFQIQCGDRYDPAAPPPPPTPSFLPAGYGTCTGTSMASPHVASIVGLMLSANPLLLPDEVRTLLGQNSSRYLASMGKSNRVGWGIPNARKVVEAALGSSAAVNRLTPLFSFYSSAAESHLYTSFPQVARAALAGHLLPRPITGSGLDAVESMPVFNAIGSPVPGYPTFPTAQCVVGPCEFFPAKAVVQVFGGHVNPTSATYPLVPLYRMSYRCPDWVGGAPL